ncbi:metal ion resistance protein/transporter [Aspergillus terreus]|uniref:Metal ion resistance protein/transporter n=1 Tax=Aspergillus terreus TaxID=33178 RepID=A0A5M3YNQ2_ASPTE|nr:hypothetical protein ATETN484_0002021300 [Aspergillus terreus]GFF15069.1 metal ion resistance protein/transporter [Aspergillus terreus]
MNFKISRIQRLSAVIGISTSFFIAEIAVGFYTGSLALVADAFHYLSDIVGFVVALAAATVEQKSSPPQALTFGWQRSQLVGAFFNGVLLFGLGISVFLQSIERFIKLEKIEQPKLVMIIGCVGFGLNLISVMFLHEHDHGDGHGHSHGHDYAHEHPEHEQERGHVTNTNSSVLSDGKHAHHKHYLNASATKPKTGNFDLALMGVFIHIMGDCANNLGVIIAGLVIWLADYGGRYYADPAVSMAIAIMILFSSLPLIKRSGLILLQSAPDGVEHEDVKHDLEQIPGIRAVHELHIWRLNQKKSLASAHLVLENDDDLEFHKLAKTVNECFHAYGIHSVTLQPESRTGVKKATSVTRVVSQGSEEGADGQGEQQRPIALRQDYITSSKISLILSPYGDAQSVAAYKVKDRDGQTVFTASGWKYNGGSCRGFRDASGLPLFELHRNISIRSTWYITLPGDERGFTLATGAPRFAPAFGNFSITLNNAAAMDTKSVAEKELTLVIERHGHVLQSFDVIDGDRRVADVCESVRHNDKLALTAGSRRTHRPALDIVITPGVDMALIVAVSIIASDSVFGSDSS